MNLTKEEKDYIIREVEKLCEQPIQAEKEKFKSNLKWNLIYNSGMFKLFNSDVIKILENNHMLAIITDFKYCFFCRGLEFSYENTNLDIRYTRTFRSNSILDYYCDKINDISYSPKPLFDHDSIFNKAFIEVKDLKYKAARMTVVNDLITKLSKEIISLTQTNINKTLKEFKEVLESLDYQYSCVVPKGKNKEQNKNKGE